MNNLKRLKEMHKITQTDLAKILETTQQQVSKYEIGARELKESQIKRLCREFNVSADFLLGIEDEER